MWFLLQINIALIECAQKKNKTTEKEKSKTSAQPMHSDEHYAQVVRTELNTTSAEEKNTHF